MIQSKEDLKQCIQEELGVYYPPHRNILKICELWIRGGELLYLWEFHYSLRTYEYYLNQKRLSVWGKLCKQYWRFIFRHVQLKTQIFINPNQTGHGLRLCHSGYRYIGNTAILGNYCTILPMVLIGMKNGRHGKCIIGDHVDISTGVTILAPVTIGSNVIIGAVAVVTRDIPSDCNVAGVPARVITSYHNCEEGSIWYNYGEKK